jgi:regulation of enolase protein 1 (concanavalin A-like superfamily)
MLSNRRPFHEQLVAHYQGRMGLPDSSLLWTLRGRDLSVQQYGYEKGGFEVDHGGWGGLTSRRPNNSPGDPCYFSAGSPVFRMNTLPGTVEAEDYDYFVGSGQSKTYYELTATNSGGQYRSAEAVDIESCSEGGFNVTSMEPGEWINYTVNIPASGNYNIVIRYAAANANGKIRFDFDGVNKTGDVAVPFGGTASGGLQDWKDFTVATGVSLSSGVQSMRIYIAGTQVAFNLNKITLIDAVSVSPPAAPTNLTAKAGNGDVALSWTASLGATSYNVKRSGTAGGPYTTIVTGLTNTKYTNTGLTNGTTYYYVVSAVNANGEGSNSLQVSATPLATLLPNPWVNTEIGTATGGSATYSNGVFTVKGAGSDIGGTADNFHYMYQPVSGDLTITARLASRVIGGTSNDKVGIMIRETTASNARRVSLIIDASTVNSVANRARMVSRSATGGSSAIVDGTGQSIPVFLKLQRSGNVFTSYVSTDGVTYTQVGSVTISMASSVLVGAAVCSRDAASVNTSTFDQVSVTQPSTPPSAPAGLTATEGDAREQLVRAAAAAGTVVFPNPVSGRAFYIKPFADLAGKDITVIVTDLGGRLVLAQRFPKCPADRLEVLLPATVTAGMYYISVNNKVASKLLIEK